MLGNILGKDNLGKHTDQNTSRDISGKGISNNYFYPIYGIILLIILFIIYIILKNPEEPVVMIRRFVGTCGYLAMFLAIITSEYMAKMKKVSGLSFIKAHHNLARVGILLILIHPLTNQLKLPPTPHTKLNKAKIYEDKIILTNHG